MFTVKSLTMTHKKKNKTEGRGSKVRCLVCYELTAYRSSFICQNCSRKHKHTAGYDIQSWLDAGWIFRFKYHSTNPLWEHPQLAGKYPSEVLMATVGGKLYA